MELDPEALAALVDSKEISSWKMEKYSSEIVGYLSTHSLLTLKTRDNREKQFFVKTSLADGSVPTGYFETEVEFFHRVVPMFQTEVRVPQPNWYPKPFFAKNDTIVLEDLRSQGFYSKLPEIPWTPADFKAALNCLAHLHASSIVVGPSKLNANNSFSEKFFTTDQGLQRKWLEVGADAAEVVAQDVVPDYEIGLVKLAYDLTLKNHSSSGPRDLCVLCHGNLWSKNVMFDGENRCRLVDYQTLACTSFANDVLQLLYLNSTLEFRRKHEEELIAGYRRDLGEILKMNGSGWLDNEEAIERDLREKRMRGLVTAVQVLPIALLNELHSREYADERNFEELNYRSRGEFVRKCMRNDENYRARIEEILRELVEFMRDNNNLT